MNGVAEINTAARMPYIVGGWVNGPNHYGRERLIEYLLGIPEHSIWVVGTRRMGKTSLLRQLELLTRTSEELVPLFWDMQGCENYRQLSEELYFSVELVAHRFTRLGIDLTALANEDANVILRRLSSQVHQKGKRLLLLIDETEALIEIGRTDPNGLARLRKSLQSGLMRTIVTSTKLLTKLHDVSPDLNTSPFLFGFNLANLWRLDEEFAVALIEQSQSSRRVRVAEPVIDDILAYTNAQPYLIQFLCQRLFRSDEAGNSYLRPTRESDLQPDYLLAGFFQYDFQYLSPLERRLLLAVTELTVVSFEDLLVIFSDETPTRIGVFLYGLHRLGYLRQMGERWAVGNEFLCRWMKDHFETLSQYTDAVVDDKNIEALLLTAREQEERYLHNGLSQPDTDLIDLRRQSMPRPSRHDPSTNLDAGVDRETGAAAP